MISIAVLFATFKIAPLQEVASEKAKQAEEARQLAQKGPLQIQIEESWSDEVDTIWLFDKPLKEGDIKAFNKIPAGPFWQVKRFADSRSGIRTGVHCKASICDGSKTRFKLRLTGHRQRPVQVTQMSARVLKKEKPPTGSFISGPSGGLDDVQAGIVFLDSEDLRFKIVHEDGSIGRPLVDEKSIYMERGEPVVFEIFAVSKTWGIQWEMVLDLLVEGVKERVVIRSDGTSNGKPFRNPGRIYDRSKYGVYGGCEMSVPSATCKAVRNGRP